MTDTKKILVIEDSEALLNDIIEMLTLEGFETIQAKNGKIGLDMVEEHHPDLIVCDVRMPVMDGYEVLSNLRANPATTNIPFIFLTARTARSDMRDGMSMGAADYVTKPFTAEELIKTVMAQLSKTENFQAEMENKMEQLRHNIMLALPHELRTPMNSILGFSEIMMTDTLNLDKEQVFDMATHINKAALRLYRLIENYVIYTSLEIFDNDPKRKQALKQGRTRYPYVIVAQQAEEISRRYNRENDLKLTIVPVDDQLAVEGDHLSRVINELVDNAFKFSQSGTPVLVSMEEHPNYLQITVSDRGTGMTQEEIESIGAYIQFHREFHEQQGVGFGLIIAKRIIELHDGEFTIMSDVGSYTTITIKLPFADEDNLTL